jgi:hypothetical protein
MEILKADSSERGEWCIDHSQYAALAASAVVSFVSLMWLFSRSKHGIDLTDESFYILWISNPWIYDASLSQFGFIYHPLYKLVGGDIVLLRKANALTFFALAFGLGTVLFEKTLSAGANKTSGFRPVRRSVIIGLSFAFSSTALLGFLPWLPTPSYNSLGLQALLLAGIGVLLAEREVSGRSAAGWCLLGAAGWLSFMAKPSSAAALGFTVGIYLLLAGKFQIKLILLGALTAVSLLIASAWVIDGSVAGFVERLQKGLELYKHLTTGHPRQNVFRLGQFGLTWEDGKILTAGLVFLVGSVTMLHRVCRVTAGA